MLNCIIPRTEYVYQYSPKSLSWSIAEKMGDHLFTAERPNHQLSWWNGIAPLGQNLCISA